MEFYERNESVVQAEQAKLDRQASEWGVNAPILYLNPGSTMVRVLPPYSDAGAFFRMVMKHRVVTHPGARPEIFACPLEETGQPCAICEKGAEFTESKNEIQMEFAREQLRPKAKYLYNVLCLSGPTNSKGETPEFGVVYVMEAGVMVHRQIISLDQDPATGWADVTNISNGVSLIIKRTGQKFETKYEVNPHGSGRTDLTNDCTERGIEFDSLNLINLDEVYTIPDAEKVESVANAIRLGGISSPSAAPVAQPVLRTVSPSAAAAPAAPAAPAVPVPVAPPAPQPVAPAPVAVPVPAPQPVPATVESPVPATTEPPVPQPQAPAVPAPPTE